MKIPTLGLVLALGLQFLIILHIYISPYTKVEESFNLQATHDILKHGLPLKGIDSFLRKHYDHLTFSGAVPRTFIGPLLLSGLVNPVIPLFPFLDRQLLARGALGSLNSFAVAIFYGNLHAQYGYGVGIWYLLLQMSQFHVIYYASRTLPNMFAFSLTTVAFSLTISPAGKTVERWQRNQRLAFYLLAFAGVVYRSEIALLLFILVVYHILGSGTSIQKVVIPAGLAGTLVGLIVSVPVDTLFWRSSTPLWPELHGFVFNVFHGKSSEWGTSPWHYYFTSALPRLLLNPLSFPLLVPLSLVLTPTRRVASNLIIPSFVFVSVYSLQPHKEWRFIVYVVPPLTAASAFGANWIWTRRNKTLLYQVASLALMASILLSFIVSTAMAVISSHNYPGGNALARLQEIASNSTGTVSVHMDVLSCMTGVSRFQERPIVGKSSWTYDKTEDEETLLKPEFWEQFDYVLAERPEKVIGGWEVIDTIYGFGRLEVLARDQPGPGYFSDGKISQGLKSIEDLVRKHVTGGRWLKVRMKPQVRILRKGEIIV